MKKVVVILGPTASGKTSLSIKLAKHFNFDIINGDSTQVYKYHDIGTAKITEDEKSGIKHYLIDTRHPSYKYSVYDYQKDVRNILDNNPSGKIMIVGGSGYYLKSSLYDYKFVGDKIDDDILLTVDVNFAYNIIKEKYPDFIFDEKNERKIISIYRRILCGENIMENNLKDKLLYDVLPIYLDLDRDKQEKIFKNRIENQIKNGFLDEVRYLIDNNLIRLDILGYKELKRYLDNEITLEEAKNLILKRTKDLAKKQKTYFKNQFKNLKIINCMDKDLFLKTKNIIEEFLKS